MRLQPDLTINGLALPLASAGEIEQSYAQIGGFSVLRMADGSAVPQKRWRKLATTLQATGLLPPGLAAVNWDAPVTLGCVGSRAIQSASTTIALPAARRTDAPPYAFAVLAGARVQPTPVDVTEDVASVTAVTGAVGYVVHYYPLLTVLSPGPQERYDALGAVASWTLDAEEA